MSRLRTHFSLREQLIAAMAPRLQRPLAESVFENDLWPVLEAAMAAGALVVARKAPKQLPVAEGIMQWLEAIGWWVSRVKNEEDVISKRKLLDEIYKLDEQARAALTDARAVAPKQLFIPPKEAPQN